MGDHVTFHSSCRICSNKTNGFAIYSEEGRLHRLEEKLKRFLSISVSEEDSLPKMVCTLCFKKLDSIFRFAARAADTQVKLSERLKALSDPNNHRQRDDGSVASPMRDDDDVSTESASEKEDEDPQKSLLHSILTKRNDGSNDQGSSNDHESSNDQVTELEVKIDPMLFFCDQDDEDEGDDRRDREDNDRVSSPTPTSPSSVDNNSIYSDADTSYSTHSDYKPYQCNICPRGFNSDLSLRNHLWNHLPSSRKVLVSSDLNTHQTETSSQKDKEGQTPKECLCQICGRVYPSKGTLRAHQITHSNVRPHKCSLCDKTFKRNQDLKFHINQHTGARPYRCPYCPKAFASSGNCFSHRKRMHPKQLARDKNKIISSRH